jgi:hypothetical protein
MITSDQTALWLAVIALGAYHGLNPAMGWPLAVANGMTAGRASAVFTTLLPLAAGHLLAMGAVLLPFALMSEFIRHREAIQFGAGGLALLFGGYKLIDSRHPRYLARIRPTQIVWWSFSMATAHGAALMLAPVALGLCATPLPDADAPGALATLARTDAVTAARVAVVHTSAMLVSAITIAWLCYRCLGLQVLRLAWLDLDKVWGASLVVAGAASCAVVVWAGRASA